MNIHYHLQYTTWSQPITIIENLQVVGQELIWCDEHAQNGTVPQLLSRPGTDALSVVHLVSEWCSKLEIFKIVFLQSYCPVCVPWLNWYATFQFNKSDMAIPRCTGAAITWAWRSTEEEWRCGRERGVGYPRERARECGVCERGLWRGVSIIIRWEGGTRYAS